MLGKLSAFILLATASTVVYAQKTPEAPKQPERRAQTMIFSDFFGGGSYLGVQTQEVTRENFSRFGLSEVRGVAVEKVLENSPAAQAGLQDGDVIVRFNGEEVTSTRKLTRLISEVAPDHQARLIVMRGGSEREVVVTMGKRPMPKFENGAFEMRVPPGGEFKMPPMPRVEIPQVKELLKDRMIGPGEGNVFVFSNNRQIGVSVSTLTKQLGDYFGVTEGKGLLINDVRADSPAAKAGLKAGDVIIEVEGKEVKSTLDLMRGINEKKEGDVTLIIVRDRNRQTVRVTPEKGKGLSEFFFDFDEKDGLLVQPMLPPTAPKIEILTPTRIL